MVDAAVPPLVSAIIVVLDSEDFLGEAIDSASWRRH
jgi:hypothetical protein